jgi:hypothetical protein
MRRDMFLIMPNLPQKALSSAFVRSWDDAVVDALKGLKRWRRSVHTLVLTSFLMRF